jgi:PAS domain S-box-containing protein
MNLPSKWPDLLRRYGLALAWSILALLVRAALPVPEGTAIFQLPLTAVVLSAWLGGRGPGLLAAAICTTVVWYWFIPPAGSWDVAPQYVLGLCVFIFLCGLLVEFGAARWRVESALRESERRFRLMAEAVTEMIWFESIEPRRMLYVSPRFERIWGRPLRDIQGDPEAWLDAVHAEDRDEARSAYRRWLAGEGSGRFDATFRIVRPGGETRFIHSRGTLIRDEEGRPYRASGIAEDVTEARRVEAALAKSKSDLAHVARMTTMGQLTASIAHEVNQPLAAMVANAAACERWLAAQPPDTARAAQALQSIVADGQRTAAVIARIRALMKRQPPRRELVDVNQAIRDVITLSQYELSRSNVVVETVLANDVPRVQGDKIQLQQVLLNLIVNGMEALSEAPEGPRRLNIGSAKDGPGGVVVSVSDNGVGLDAQGAEQIFEPFYSTKADGMGMGLAISRSTIESHGGRIWAIANTPRGAVFHFTLPGGSAS